MHSHLFSALKRHNNMTCHHELTSCDNLDPAAAPDMKQSTTALLLTTATSCLQPIERMDKDQLVAHERSPYLSPHLSHKDTR